MRNNELLLKNYSIETWQNFHVTQVAYIRNLVIILSTALIGFLAQLIIDKNSIVNANLILIKFAGFIFLLSLSIGITLALLESRNYRLKYKISRLIFRSEKDVNIDDNIEFKKIERQCTWLEKVNTCLFVSQLSLFLIAVFLLLILIIR